MAAKKKARRKTLWEKSDEAVEKLMPEIKAWEKRRQAGADKLGEALRAGRSKKKTKKKAAKKNPLMKGKIDRTPRKKKSK